MDRLSDIDEFEEVFKAGIKEKRSEGEESGQFDVADILTEIVDNIFDEDDEEDTEADDDSTPHILSLSPVSRGKEEEVVGHDAQFNPMDSEDLENDGVRHKNFNQEIENLSPSAEQMAKQIGLQSDKSNFSIEGEELLSEENLTDKQSTENRLDEQSLQQRKSDRNLDVSQERDYHENKTFFGISLGRRILKYSTSFLDNIFLFQTPIPVHITAVEKSRSQ